MLLKRRKRTRYAILFGIFLMMLYMLMSKQASIHVGSNLNFKAIAEINLEGYRTSKELVKNEGQSLDTVRLGNETLVWHAEVNDNAENIRIDKSMAIKKSQRARRKLFKPNFDWVQGRLARKEKMLGRKLDFGENCTKVLPHAIIFGVMKGGTEALSTFLSIHPDIAMQLKLQTILYFNVHYMKGLEWYRNQMPCSSKGQITIEKSPQYFTARYVPERIHEMNSSIKLIAIVREPIKRAISHYSHVKNVKPGLYQLSFEETILDSLGQIDRSHETILKSTYSVQLKRWLEYFKPEQIHIVDGDNFQIHQVEELRKIETFLGLKHYITQDHFVFNEEKGFYCLNVTGQEECMSSGKGRLHPDINPDVILRLKQFFKPYNEDLFNLIGRRFSWNY